MSALTLRADLYWSFRSPYSYLAIGRYRALSEAYDLEIALKPVYPLAIRQPDFFERNHPNWLGYTVRDVAGSANISASRSRRRGPIRSSRTG